MRSVTRAIFIFCYDSVMAIYYSTVSTMNFAQKKKKTKKKLYIIPYFSHMSPPCEQSNIVILFILFSFVTVVLWLYIIP
jgi:hypothetical protein